VTLAGFGSFCLKTMGDTFAGLGLKTRGTSQGGRWHHLRACVKAKVLREGSVVIRCKELNLDHFCPCG